MDNVQLTITPTRQQRKQVATRQSLLAAGGDEVRQMASTGTKQARAGVSSAHEKMSPANKQTADSLPENSSSRFGLSFGSLRPPSLKPDSPAAPELIAEIDRVVETALKEDLRGGADITSTSVLPPGALATACIIVKQTGILAGLLACERVFQHIDPAVTFTVHLPDGTLVSEAPVVCATLYGCARSILTGERTALNLMQRLSGIATMTHRFAAMAGPSGIAILDTRKTTPGLRLLEKYAVAIGGGSNHRFGLYDHILIKDNHVRLAGSVTEAMSRARQSSPGQPLEVEVTTLAEVKQAVEGQAEKIMLDNMPPQAISQAVEIIQRKSFVEVSGGINLDNISAYLLPGVNAISIGALTHSVQSLDISLEIEG